MPKIQTMTQGRPLRLLIAFALPLMLGNIFQQLYTVVDTAIVGRGVGLDALAALGTVDWMNWMVLGIATGFTQGFSVRIAQKFGEGDWDGVRFVAGQSAVLSFGIALLCTALIQLGLPLFLALLRIPQELRALASLYTRVLMAGFPLVVLYNYCSAILRGIGDGKTPLLAMIVAAFTNIILDCVTVFVLRWGIAGAAAATVFAQGVSAVVCILKIRRTPLLRFGKQQLRMDMEVCTGLVGLGAPISAKNILVALGGMTIQTIVNGFGTSFIAGFTATNKLYGVLETAALSYGYAVTTYVGQNYGAKQPDRIRKGMRAATVLSLLTSVVIAAVMIVFGRPITMLFISADDPGLVAAAGDTAYLYLVFMSVSLPVLYVMYAYQAALQGMGRTVIPMFSGCVQLALRVGLALVVGWTGYEMGIFGAEVAAWYGAAVILVVSYFRCIRKAFPKDATAGHLNPAT